MPNCFVPTCNNSYAKGFVMLRFPRDDELREKWRIAVGRDGCIPTTSHRICEVHFERSQWEKFRCRLKSDAVPTLFCNCYDQMEGYESPSGPVNDSSEPNIPVHLSDHMYSLGRTKLPVKLKVQAASRSPIHLDACCFSPKAYLQQKNPVTITPIIVTPDVSTLLDQKNVNLTSDSATNITSFEKLKEENNSLKQEVAVLKNELRIKTKLLAEKEKKLKSLMGQHGRNKLPNETPVIKGPYSFPPGTILLVEEVSQKGSTPVASLKPVSLKRVIPGDLQESRRQKGSIRSDSLKPIQKISGTYSSITDSLD